MGEVRKGSHRDVDATFQKERDAVNEMVQLMRDVSVSYNNKTYHVQSKWHVIELLLLTQSRLIQLFPMEAIT